MELKLYIVVSILASGLIGKADSLREAFMYNEQPLSDLYGELISNNDEKNIDDTDMWIDPTILDKHSEARSVFGIYTDQGLRLLNDKFVQTFIVPKFDRIFNTQSTFYPEVIARRLLPANEDNVIKESNFDDASTIIDKDVISVNGPITDPWYTEMNPDLENILQLSSESFPQRLPNLSSTDKINTESIPNSDAYNAVVQMPSKRYSFFHTVFNKRPSTRRRAFRDLYGRNELKRNRYYSSRSRYFDPLASRIIG
ncbi:hypothetical protein ACF0H5_020214 [Mactra antiquata]